MTESSPPVISLRPLREGRSNDQTRGVVDKVEASFKKFGCVCIPVSDLDSGQQGGKELISRCYSAAESFFALPEETKAVYTEKEAGRQGYGGSCYTPLGKEPAYLEGEKQHVESFSCTRPLEESLCNHLPRGPEFHNNLFPDAQVSDFGAAHTSLWEALRQRVALPMMDALEQMIDLPSGFLAQKSAETRSLNMSLLRTLRYPARDGLQPCTTPQTEDIRNRRRSTRTRADCATSATQFRVVVVGTRGSVQASAPPPPIDVGISDHTDFEVFTIMHQESAGLHLRTPSRGPSPHWYQPPFRYDTLTVILGDMAELWTSGWLEATRHKVDSPASGQEPRRSFVLFQAHDDRVRVHPLGLTHLAGRKEEARTPTSRDRSEEDTCDQSPRPDSIAEWIRHRSRKKQKKYRPTTQGAWVRKRESQAKSALEKAAEGL